MGSEPGVVRQDEQTGEDALACIFYIFSFILLIVKYMIKEDVSFDSETGNAMEYLF